MSTSLDTTRRGDNSFSYQQQQARRDDIRNQSSQQQQRRRPPTRDITDDNIISNQNRVEQKARQTASIDCPHFGTCPGCVRMDNVANIDIVNSAKMFFASSSIRKYRTPSSTSYNNNNNNYFDNDDEEEEFFKIVIPSPITQWRTQAKLAISPKNTWSRSSGCIIGLYQRNSHDVVPIPECKVHHPSINTAIDLLTQATQNVRTSAYNENTGEGLLRHVQVRVDTLTNKVCITLVMNAERYKDTQPQLSHLAKELRRLDGNNDLFHSIWVHCNDSKGNAIFSRDVTRWHPVDGLPYVRERIPGSYDNSNNNNNNDDDDDEEEEEEENNNGGYLYYAPHVFRQANLDGFAIIAKEVCNAISPGSKVCELYAGVGYLGLSALLHHGKNNVEEGRAALGWLRCSDDNPENVKCFERSVNSLPSSITGRSESRSSSRFSSNNGRGGRGGGGGGRGGRGRGGRGGRGGGRGGRRGTTDVDEMSSIKDLMDSMLSSENNDSPIMPETNPTERVTYLQANAALALYRGQALGANVLIVDPPRKGLDEVVLQQLCQKINGKQLYTEKPTLIAHLPRHTINWTNDVRTLIYVSCGFDALARDLDGLLTSNAGWKLDSATGYVLFPGSNHVETVVVLRR
jgi:tRNA/tmRNA/rRNA uracil-C5-methylase (TrmA/RlmC/RlmD family)